MTGVLGANTEPVIELPCPACGTKTRHTESAVFQGLRYCCPNCMNTITTAPPVRQEHVLGVRVTAPNGNFKDFNITVRDDGLWSFGDEHEQSVTKRLAQDSDRAAGIIASSIIDIKLERILIARHKFFSADVRRHLFQPSGQLGSFSTRIDLAYMTGMFTDEAYKDLIILKKIRNDFAHRLDVEDFETQSIRNRCQNLGLIETHVGDFPNPAPIGAKLLSFGFEDRPRIYVRSLEDRKKVPRERYLITAQLFSVCLAPAEIPGHPFPLV